MRWIGVSNSRFEAASGRPAWDLNYGQLALAGKAEHLVTGDRDLLALANRFSCAIIKPEAWLQTLAKV